MYILANMWFTKLIKQFFFWIDKIVFNFISSIYDLLITIARTSVLTQADIADMAERIYKLLAVFMIFKVTLSLITYVVNPETFSDKDKGVTKLGTNIIISLALLILTPYIFNYAYQFQTIILEDNSLATLIFGGEKKEKSSFFNSAGDDMAFITMSAFIGPNLSVGELHECSMLIDSSTNKINPVCKEKLEALTDEDGEYFSAQTLKNYIAGIENNSLGLLFRQDLVLATTDDNEDFIMDYKFIFSTVTGVVIILLLITFCMEIAVRSIKLAFLQLLAPVPILSYVDPKSGKDGMFKKWYETCFKTFFDLFVRLIALYFAVYIISRVAKLKMVDVVNGSYQTGFFLSVFIIIGALMFAKQVPEFLKNLGLPIGDAKFTLNPIKKFENEALGGKQLAKPLNYAGRAAKGVGAAAAVGGAALVTGQGFRGVGRAFGNAMKGKKFGENFSNSYGAARARKRQVQQMKLDGVTPMQAFLENARNTVIGGATAKDKYDDFNTSVKAVQDGYSRYYNGVLGADKIAKEFERRRKAAENAGDHEGMQKWETAIDARVKQIQKNDGKIVLDATSKDISSAVSSVENGGYDATLTYEKEVTDKGLNNIRANTTKTIEHINTHYQGKFDYDGELKADDDMKTIKGKASGVERAAVSSAEARKITDLYKYVDKKSNK